MAKKDPIGHDERGRPIWGYSKKFPSKPCCSYPARHGPCQRTTLCPNGRCAQNGHGGANPGRPIVHGRRSEALKGLRLQEAFDDLVKDPESLNHYENIATATAIADMHFARTQPPI